MNHLTLSLVAAAAVGILGTAACGGDKPAQSPDPSASGAMPGCKSA